MLNIAEILKNCPTGTKLYSPIFGELLFHQVTGDGWIKVENIGTKIVETFYPNGLYSKNGECMLFPSKENKDWKGFVPPCKFKIGDVVVDDSGAIFIYKQIHTYYEEPYADFYCGLTSEFRNFIIKTGEGQRCGKISSIRLATKEEKQKLFDVIKANGYKWNAETKTLEKLIVPKFKVGDKVRGKYTNNIYTISRITSTGYELTNGQSFTFIAEDCHELVLNKFDITTLKPFDKVLARCSSLEKWKIQFFEKFDKTCKFPFICMGYNKYAQCIPYEGNEHLLDTADSCSEYYKTW